MYKNIIFDLGNVVLDYNPKVYLKNKLNDTKSEELVLDSIFKSKEWPMLDRGTITEEVAIKNIVSRNIESKDIIELAFENRYEMLTPLNETVDIIKELKDDGYKIYYLSNFHSKAFEIVTEKYEFFNLFEGGIVSFREQLLKPEKEIYNRLLERYGLIPEESIFIDDVLENVKGAGEEGIKGIQFKNINELRKELNECGVLKR